VHVGGTVKKKIYIHT